MRISPLRQRMIEDMTVRHFAEKAQKDLHLLRQEPCRIYWPAA